MYLIKVTAEMIGASSTYSKLSQNYTSRKHDFHEGGAELAARKMNEGKIGEQAFKAWLIQEKIPFTADQSSFDQADDFDFLINGFKIDVKTRTKDYHTRTLEMVEQFNKRPKDLYVSTRYFRDRQEVLLIGVISAQKLKALNHIENQGYQVNYVAYDHELSSLDTFKNYILTHKKKAD